MPSPPNLTNALKAVMQSGLPDHYRLVLISSAAAPGAAEGQPAPGLGMAECRHNRRGHERRNP